VWIDFINVRNKLSHIYETAMAEDSYVFILTHVTAFDGLYTTLHPYATISNSNPTAGTK
jgi:hypothetical protein